MQDPTIDPAVAALRALENPEPPVPQPKPAPTPSVTEPSIALDTTTPPALEITLEDIEKKVELGQDLTEDEQKKLEELEKSVPEPDPEVTYRIAGKPITYTEAAKKWREETGIGELDINKESEKKNVELWVRAQNKSEQSKAADQRAQTVAHDRANVVEGALQIKQQELSSMYIEVQRRQEDLQRIADEKTYLQSIISRKPTDQEIASNDGVLSFDRQADLMNAKRAELDLQRLDVTEQAAKQRLAQFETKLAETQNEATFLDIERFVTTQAKEFIPTSGSFASVVSKYMNGEELPPDDWTRMHELVGIVKEHDSTGARIDQIYQYKKSTGQLTVKGAQPSNSRPSLPTPLAKVDETIQRVSKLRARLSTAPATRPASKGTTAGTGVDTPESLAKKLVEGERIADSATQMPKSAYEGTITNPQRAVPV